MFQHNAERLLRLIERVYRWLPLGTVVNNKVLVVHGGISDITDLDWVRNLDRHKVRYIHTLCDFIKRWRYMRDGSVCISASNSAIHTIGDLFDDVCSSFNDAVSNSDHNACDDCMILNNDLERR
jgi:hypothetical protein